MALVLDGTNGVSGVDGTASSPSLEGTDSNTGVFFPAADTVAIGTGGTERLRVDSAGNAGLGVTPSAFSVGKAIQVGSTSGLTLFGFGNGAEVGGNFNFDSGYKYVATGAATRMTMGSGFFTWNIAPSGTAGNAITFTQAMTLDASGQLELTAAAPRLAIAPSTGTNNAFVHFINSASANFSYVGIDSNGGGLGGQYTMNLWHGANYAMVFATNNTERARITSGGDFLVGKTAADDTTPGVWLYNNSAQAGRINIAKNTSGLFNAVANYYSGTYVGGVNYSNTATSFPTSSDIRLKKDIVDAGSASAKIEQIRIVSHGWKHDDEIVEFGVVAQELANIAPQAVSIGDDGEEVQITWGVDYSKLVPMLIKAHQEQQAMIDELKAKVAALENA